MCDNCSSLSREKKPRDFRIADLHATMIRHSDFNPKIRGCFRQYCYYHDEHMSQKLKDEPFKYVRKRMHEYGFGSKDIATIEKMYKAGMEVIRLLKERGIQHQPRKKKNVR